MFLFKSHSRSSLHSRLVIILFDTKMYRFIELLCESPVAAERTFSKYGGKAFYKNFILFDF